MITNKVYICKFCKKEYKTFGNYILHVRNKHLLKITKGQYPCGKYRTGR
jgi:hypothetical protein